MPETKLTTAKFVASAYVRFLVKIHDKVAYTTMAELNTELRTSIDFEKATSVLCVVNIRWYLANSFLGYFISIFASLFESKTVYRIQNPTPSQNIKIRP